MKTDASGLGWSTLAGSDDHSEPLLP